MILSVLLTLGACVSQEKRDPPDWSTVALPTSEVTEPTRLPVLCEITVIDGADGQRYGVWSPDCWQTLQAYEITAEANTDIALANANALRSTEAAYAALVSAGKLQGELTVFYAELLEDERKGRFIDGLLYKTLIGLGFIVVLL